MNAECKQTLHRKRRSARTFERNRFCNTFIIRDIEGALIYTTTILEPNITLNFRLSGLSGTFFEPNLSPQLSFLVSEIARKPLTSFLANLTREYLHNWPSLI